jgi:hypothetical protein
VGHLWCAAASTFLLNRGLSFEMPWSLSDPCCFHFLMCISLLGMKA